MLESYPEHNRLAVSVLTETLGPEPTVSADTKLIDLIANYSATHPKNLRAVGFDAPLSLPKCLRCDLPCPGAEKCEEPEIRWMRQLHFSQKPHPKTRTYFTPYTQRCAEAYWLSRKIDLQHALGSNLAPLTARALFLQRRLQVPCWEVSTRLAVAKLGEHLQTPKSVANRYRNSVGGDEAREKILGALVEKLGIFIYQQDLRAMIQHPSIFESLMVAISVHYKDLGQTVRPPEGFPKNEIWPIIPDLS